MICPYCEHNDDKVIDSRASDAGRVVRRRRECLKCHKRFTTYEKVEETNRLTVVKRDGTRVPFSREKIEAAVAKAADAVDRKDGTGFGAELPGRITDLVDVPAILRAADRAA